MKRREVFVGTYNAGMGDWKVVLRQGDSAEFHCAPELGSCPVITMGADVTWVKLLEYTVHEAFELAMLQMQCRFIPSFSPSNTNDAYLFIMSHQQFAECCAIVAQFLSQVVPDLANAYKKWNKKGKKKNR